MSAYIRNKGAYQKTPYSSTSEVILAKERELGQQLQENETEILGLRANYEIQASQNEREVRNLQTAIQEALEKRDHDMRELSRGVKSTLDEKDMEIEKMRERFNVLLHAHESQQRNINVLQRNGHAESVALREKLTTAEQELDLCRDDLFRMQPVCWISDASISTAFESLSEQLINWIDDEISAFEKAIPHAHVGCLFFGSEDPDVAHFLQMYPSAGEYLCRHMVNRYLLEHLFGSNVHHFGLSAEYSHIILVIEHGMAVLKPPKGTSLCPVDFLGAVLCLTISDPRTVNIWRAETLSALAVTPECIDLKEEHTSQLTLNLFGSLRASLPNLFGRVDAMQRFHDQVAIPATTIVSNLQGLASPYRLDMVGKDFRNCQRVTRDDLRKVIAIDVKTGKALKPGSATVSDREGFIGRFVLSLEPSLHRVNEGTSDTDLRQETWLVSLDDALESKDTHGD